MNKRIKNNKGVTLVALVVTIIVLIILAGISINLVLGDNGIITIAKRAKENIEFARIEEETELNELYSQLENTGGISEGTNYDAIAKLTEFKTAIANAINEAGGIKTDITAEASVFADNIKGILKEVTKEYSKGVAALNGINLKIEQGEFVFIVGDSGSGKSTLIKLIMKELEPTSGTIIVNGNNLSRMKHRRVPMYRRNIGVVFQDFRLLKDRNIYENIAFAQRVTETSTRIIKKKVPAALSLVGLAQKYKAFPKELSGGEQQRVAIARAIVNEPAILLADEPTGNLDPTNSWEIMKLLEEANDRGTTVLVVTHNQEIVNEMQKRVVTMKKGVIVSDEKKGGYKHEN